MRRNLSTSEQLITLLLTQDEPVKEGDCSHTGRHIGLDMLLHLRLLPVSESPADSLGTRNDNEYMSRTDRIPKSEAFECFNIICHGCTHEK